MAPAPERSEWLRQGYKSASPKIINSGGEQSGWRRHLIKWMGVLTALGTADAHLMSVRGRPLITQTERKDTAIAVDGGWAHKSSLKRQRAESDGEIEDAPTSLPHCACKCILVTELPMTKCVWVSIYFQFWCTFAATLTTTTVENSNLIEIYCVSSLVHHCPRNSGGNFIQETYDNIPTYNYLEASERRRLNTYREPTQCSLKSGFKIVGGSEMYCKMSIKNCQIDNRLSVWALH